MFLSAPLARLASTAGVVVYRCVYTCSTHIFLARSHLHGSYVLFFNVYMLVQLVYLFVGTKCMFCCVSIIDYVSVSASISLHRQSSWHSSPSPSHDVATGRVWSLTENCDRGQCCGQTFPLLRVLWLRLYTVAPVSYFWCGPLLSWPVRSVVRCTAGPNLVRVVKPVRRSRHWRPKWRTLLLCAGQLGAVRSTPHRTWCGWKKPMRRCCHEPATFRR